MTVLWVYFWPMVAAGLAIGAVAGAVAYRAPRVRVKEAEERLPAILEAWRVRRLRSLAFGIALALAAALAWHGPLGAADRLAGELEISARQSLDHYEMTAVSARLDRGPLSRRIRLSGPADSFQRGELVRIIGSLPGVERATWSAEGRAIPLAVEGLASAIAGFLLGLLLAYLVELRRRYNAQWSW